MFSINNFKDEKFRDTIKKNFCRLRQKSSNQLGEFIISQTPTLNQNKITRKDKYIETDNNVTEKNIINSKFFNLDQAKIYKKRKINQINEKKPIYVKTKNLDDNYNLSLKQRIYLKLKEDRNEKLKSKEKNEYMNNNNNKNSFHKETSYKNYIVNHKKIINSMDINNVACRNKNSIENKNKDISSTINYNESNNKDSENINIKINLDKKLIINRNYKNLYSQGNKTIFNQNNSNFKYNNTNNSTIFLTKNNTNKINEKNEILDTRSLLTNKENRYGFDNDQLSENFIINKRKNHNINKNNDIILVQKRNSYFNEKMKLIKRKNEEEKNKNINEEKIQKSLVLNKTFGKSINKIAYFNDNFTSNEISRININKRLRNNNSIKLTNIRSFKDLNNSRDNINKYSLDEPNINNNNNKNKKKIIYIATEKPKLFTKSILFKNLMINTDNFDRNRNNKKIINKNINKVRNINELNQSKEEIKKNSNDKQMKINIDYINNYNSPNSLTTRNNKIIITEIFKKDKHIQKSNETTTIQRELYNIDYIIKMIIEAIQLKNSIEIYSLFSILLINFNNKYIVVFSSKKFEKETYPYFDCYKYLSIFIIPLIFFYKDENIYKINNSKVKKIFENLIFICIEKLGQQCLKYKKILSFIDEFKKAKRSNELYNTMDECCSDLIKLVFKNYKEYIPLKKIIEQLLNIAAKETLEKIIYIINSTILYCFNHKQKNNFYLLTQINGNNSSKYSQSKITNQSLINNDLNKTLNKPNIPYIKTEMKKKFCLVLDIDETILHTMNLPFENYFLLRPGVVNFLEEISKLYEIIIFTSSPKSYADPILDKIDIENKFFSHRLYKDHVIFEKGKSVKNLNLIGRDLNKIIFVDNMKCNAKYNLKNLYLISTWIYDLNDQELIKLKAKLKYIANNSKFKDDITKGLESNN